MSFTDWIVPFVQRATSERQRDQYERDSWTTGGQLKTGMSKIHGEHIMALHTKVHQYPLSLSQPRIVRRAQDHIDQKLGEAIETAETTPLLNTDNGWQLLPTIRKRSST